MAENTPNYGLIKPNENEFYDIEVNNQNMDTIDEKLKENADGTQTVEQSLENHEQDKVNPHEVTKGQVGLGNVDNIKQATKTEFDNHVGNTTNPHNVTKAQIGLGNVDNVQQASQADFEDLEQDLASHKAKKASDDVHGLLSEGRIIEESGNNANGNYVRFSDGTQICEGLLMSIDLSSTSRQTFLFPASWASTPSIQAEFNTFTKGTAEQTRNLKTGVGVCASSGGSQILVDKFLETPFTLTMNMTYIALGRWK